MKTCPRCKKPVKTGTHKQEIAGGVIREVGTWECQNCEIKYFESWIKPEKEETPQDEGEPQTPA